MSVHLRRTILKLAFADRVAYCRFEGVRTPEKTFPFNALGGSGAGVENGGPDRTNLEPLNVVDLLEGLEEWSDILKAEPEVIQRLEEIAARERDGDCEAEEHLVFPQITPPEPGL